MCENDLSGQNVSGLDEDCQLFPHDLSVHAMHVACVSLLASREEGLR